MQSCSTSSTAERQIVQRLALLEAQRRGLKIPAASSEHAEEHSRCAADPVHWINTYGKTYDPRLLPENPVIPFKLFPKQAEFLRWLQNREAGQEDGLAEKSRDVGFTWLCAAYALHGWLFRRGFAAGFGSRKELLVDRIGDPDTIFEKIRILLRNLPTWQLPRGFSWTEHDNFCRLVNPETGATITGEAGDNIGRGGRKTVYFIDEAAFLERPEKAEAALSQTTRCRIWVSTPNGPGNAFAKKRFGGVIAVFTFHWKSDPRKNHFEVRLKGEVVARGQGEPTNVPDGALVVYPWYVGECRRLNDPVVVAQEIDIDYAASIEGICIPAAWVQAAVGLKLPEGSTVEVGADIAEEGKSKTVIMARKGPVVLPPISWGQMNTTQTAWKLRDECRDLGARAVRYDADGPGMGVKGTWASAVEPLPFNAVGVHGGSPASDRRWPDGRKSVERFINTRAELWWLMRIRFEKTFEYVTLGVKHPLDELISIPDCRELIADLSLPLVFTTDAGKTQLESKKDMAKRGVKSPDFGDALAYSFAIGGLEGTITGAKQPARSSRLKW